MANADVTGQRWWGRRMTRRRLLGSSAMGAAGLAAIALVGCGDDDAAKPVGGEPTEPAGTEPGGENSLSISNWPYYIDGDTIADFQSETGITVSYTQDINDNDEFFAKVQDPLKRGKSIGRDIIVLTDWMAARLIRLGWVAELDKANIPNANNLRESLKNVAFDPGRKSSLVWQSGFTGIGYNPELTGRELTSFNDIFDPAFKGHVTMLTEMRDTVGLTMLGMGKKPGDGTVADGIAAIEKIQEFVDNGHIRAFTGNEYGDDLVRGDVWAAIAWSGDMIQLQADNPQLQFLLPEEGFMQWSDNMLIPKGAEHKAQAEQFMNYVYDPAHQAQIAAYVQYFSPVDGAKDAMLEIDASLAENTLIFPDDATLARANIFRALDEAEERELNEAFQTLIGA